MCTQKLLNCTTVSLQLSHFYRSKLVERKLVERVCCTAFPPDWCGRLQSIGLYHGDWGSCVALYTPPLNKIVLNWLFFAEPCLRRSTTPWNVPKATCEHINQEQSLEVLQFSKTEKSLFFHCHLICHQKNGERPEREGRGEGWGDGLRWILLFRYCKLHFFSFQPGKHRKLTILTWLPFRGEL